MRPRKDDPGTTDAETGEPRAVSRTCGRPRDSADVAVALHDRAVAFYAGGERDKARATCRRALRLMERAVGPDHPDVAAILNSLAAIALDRAEYAEAEALFGRSARIMDAVKGDDTDIARVRIQSLGNLAAVLRIRGRYDEAEPLLRQALALAEEALGPRDVEVGSLLNQLAVLHKYQGRFAEAGPLLPPGAADLQAGPGARPPRGGDDLPQPRRARACPRPLHPR